MLLAALDPDPDAAAKVFENMRSKLIKYFEWSTCLDAGERADEVIDRVAQKIEELRNAIRVKDKFLYALGVARNVMKEYRKKTRLISLDGMKPDNSPQEDPVDDGTYELLNRCFDALPVDQQELIWRYHTEERRMLAKERGMTMNQLYLAVFRITKALRGCMGVKKKKRRSSEA